MKASKYGKLFCDIDNLARPTMTSLDVHFYFEISIKPERNACKTADYRRTQHGQVNVGFAGNHTDSYLNNQ